MSIITSCTIYDYAKDLCIEFGYWSQALYYKMQSEKFRREVLSQYYEETT